MACPYLAEMGARSCRPLRSRVPAFLNFSFAFRVPAFLYDIFFPFLCAPAFLFCVPMLLCQRAYVWGVEVQLITRALSVHRRIRRAGSTRHRAVYTYTGWKPV